MGDAIGIFRDPEAMAQITEMMQDPRFQETVQQMSADPQAISQQIEVLMQDPEFEEYVKQVAKKMEKMMQDPAFREQANRMAEDMLAGMVHQTRANPLASLLLATNPAAPRAGTSAFARSPPRHSVNARMEGGEPSDQAVTLATAALGAAAGVFLTGGLTGAAVLSAGAAYASTLDNDVGNAAKAAGSATAKSYNKIVELNEQYDVLPKAKGAADTVVNVLDNINKNYGISAKIDEKLKLSEKVDQLKEKVDDLTSGVTDKFDELKDSAKPKE